jgi:hypothetical protein
MTPRRLQRCCEGLAANGGLARQGLEILQLAYRCARGKRAASNSALCLKIRSNPYI